MNKNIGLAEILRGRRSLLRSLRPAADVRICAAGRAQRPAASTPAELAQLLRGRTALLNVIPYNPVAGLPYRTPSP